jgi:cobalt/nickel transport system permease protein
MLLNTEVEMHIPDGFLDTKTWVTAAAASTGTIAYAVKKVNKDFEEKDVPLMGVLAAFVFAAQMINFPVAGGTSGHFLGAALTTILLGPWKAMLVMLSVVSIQALLFGDGGITALGTNVLNMAVIGPLVAHFIYQSLKRFNSGIAVFLTGFSSVFIASIACSVELGISGTVPFTIALPMMAGWHFLIGIGEGIITATAVGFLAKTRPDLIKENMPLGKQGALVITGIAAFVALVLSPFASAFPDGLERVAEDAGFLEHSKTLFNALIPDYAMPGVGSEALATALAGIIGVAITLAAAFTIATIFRKKSGEA